jgi:tricorn protease
MRMFRLVSSFLFLLTLSTSLFAQSSAPLLLHSPTVNATDVVFVFAGDLWTVSRSGGDARRLTSGAGTRSNPFFSPDGSKIAFTNNIDGNADVYVMPASGGPATRLTWHPSPDQVSGWTADGRQILFASGRNSYARVPRLFTVGLNGGLPEQLPLPQGLEGSYSPDGQSIAYVPTTGAYQIWKRYRGGLASAVWIARLSDSSVTVIPRNGSNDFSPVWIGDRVYFISDRDGARTLYAYDTKTKDVKRLIENNGFDLRHASAGPGVIAYEQFGSIHLYDLASGVSRALDVRVASDVAAARPQFINVGSRLTSGHISPSGARALFDVHGEIVSVPAEKGDIRNLTNTPGVAERDPAWSPDGQRVAYFSDESGEYALHIRPQSGIGDVKKISLGDVPSFFYDPIWSPDGKKIVFSDKRLNLWYVDVDSSHMVKIDTDTYDLPWRQMAPSWSPDSRWIAYSKQLPNHFGTIFLYSLDNNRSSQLTDGLSDTRMPRFDRNGKYLYFLASTDVAASLAWLDMSSINRPVTRSAYLVVLSNDAPSPLAPESDEEKAVAADRKADDKSDKKSADAISDEKKADKNTPTRIDMDGIGQRIVALPIPARNYSDLQVGKPGQIFLAEGNIIELPADDSDGPRPSTIHRFDLEKRKTDKLLDRVTAFEVSANGEKVLFQQDDNWTISSADKPSGDSHLKTAAMEISIDPRAEWRQIFHEAIRIERDYFYDPKLHGVDLAVLTSRYEPYLQNLASRSDLDFIFSDMWGELTIGHLYVSPGAPADTPKRVSVGLLGADYEVANNRYRFARVYSGENWNPNLNAPLTEPGVNVKSGDYLLAVNGQELHATDDLYRPFQGMAGHAVILRVGRDPNGAGARDVTVVPIASETALRNRNWIEENRRKVDAMSHGRVAYVYLPNTAGAGFTNFNRYYFAQSGREGVVLDERFNGGGDAADYIIHTLSHPLMSNWQTREGANFTTPLSGIFGPKAMIINSEAGSGGDAMPWYFRQAKIGTLVGTRTWGGLVGIYSDPDFIDGGHITSPRLAFFAPNGQWQVENHGVAPDVDVELDPKLWREGKDPQLERAVDVVMKQLPATAPAATAHEPFPNYHP